MQQRLASHAQASSSVSLPAAPAIHGRACTRRLRGAPPVRHCKPVCSASHTNAVLGAAVLQRLEPSRLPQVHTNPPPDITKVYDCLGLAQAMVDFTAQMPSTDLLAEPPFSVGQGLRRIITLQERHEVLAALDTLGCESQVSPGGSLANTLVAIARLAAAHGSTTRVGMAGCVGVDTLSCYFNAQLQQAGVNVVVDQDNLCHTGTVMVLTTPDAQRSFLSFFDSGSVRMTRDMAAAIAGSKMVIIEGYMLEMPGASTWVLEVARLARSSGAQLVLTAGDPTVVARHKKLLQTILFDGLVDVLFCNREEACELLSCYARCSAPSLTAALGAYTSMAVVTDGSRGACVGMHGAVHEVPPHWAPKGPVDVCGAGDAFAGGILYAHSCGYGPKIAGNFAARVAAAVISRHGAQLEVEDARELVTWLPDHVGVQWPAVDTTIGYGAPHRS